MPKKKSIKKASNKFCEMADAILQFVQSCSAGQSKEHQSWLYEYAVIRLYRHFEALILDALVGAINNDTAVASERLGFKFPKHLSDEVCQFLIIGDGYFDFKGRDGLIATLKRFLPYKAPGTPHYLIAIAIKPGYKDPLEQLSALRNFAAHASTKSKEAAKKATNQSNLGSAGAWLKVGSRFQIIVDRLKHLAKEIEMEAPY